MADKILALQASYWSRIKEAPPSTKVNIMFSSQKSSLTTCILSPIGVFSIELSASAKELVLKRNDIRSIESEASILFGMKGKEVSPRAKIIEPISAAQIVDNGFELSRNIVLSEVIPDFSFFLIKVKNLTLDLFQPKNISEEIQLKILLFSGDDRRHHPASYLIFRKTNSKTNKLTTTIKSVRQLFFAFLSQDKK